MEYCSGGDLAGYIRRHKRTPEARARSLLQQLGAGLQLLWSHNLVHVSPNTAAASFADVAWF